MDRITSAKNPLIRDMKALNQRKGRLEQGRFLVEGEVMIREALFSGLTPSEAMFEAETPLADELVKTGALVRLCDRHILETVCDTKTPQGCCAAFRLPEPKPFRENAARLLALDGVQDPGNLGTILRTADAAGFEGAFLSPQCADVYAPKVQRAAMGSGFRVPTLRCSLEETLKESRRKGFHIAVSALDGLPLYENEAALIGKKLILVIGNEAKGVSPGVQDIADIRLKIPMRGKAESLNAAVAAGILMYELTRNFPS